LKIVEENIETITEPTPEITILLQEMFKLKRPKGSIGAYTVSTLLTMLSLADV
jgi:hypothetical protein